MKMKLNYLQEVSEDKKSLFCFSTALILLVTLIYFGVVPLFEEAVFAKREYSKINEQVKIYEIIIQNIYRICNLVFSVLVFLFLTHGHASVSAFPFVVFISADCHQFAHLTVFWNIPID